MKLSENLTASNNWLKSLSTTVRDATGNALTRLTNCFRITIRFLLCRQNTGEVDFEPKRKRHNNDTISGDDDMKVCNLNSSNKSNCFNNSISIRKVFKIPENPDLPQPHVQQQSSTTIQGGIDVSYPSSYICKFEVQSEVPTAIWPHGAHLEMTSYKTLENDFNPRIKKPATKD